jgi:methionine-rich copper-binding protein CopC
LTGQALAHAHLESATPPANGSVTASPSKLDLEFSRRQSRLTGVEVKGPDKTTIATGKPTLRAGDDTTLVVPLSGTLPAGTYTVAWHSLSSG